MTIDLCRIFKQRLLIDGSSIFYAIIKINIKIESDDSVREISLLSGNVTSTDRIIRLAFRDG